MTASTRGFERVVAAAQVEQRLPSVAAGVFRDGAMIWERALGLADVARDEPATPAHRYRIGSITKTFTAVAIMQLRDAGALALDAPVRSVVAEFPPGPTFADALSHLTGVQREPPGEIWDTVDPPDREQLLAGLEDAERVLERGTTWHYSNLAYAMLGEAVERLSGSYERHLEERILRPLGLTATTMLPQEALATPYYVHPWTQAITPEPFFNAEGPVTAAGWLWSSTADLARWGDFLCVGHEGVLGRETVREMAVLRTMVDDRAWTRGWGLGVELARHGERILVGHGGAMPGFLAALYVDPATRTGAVVLTNTGAGASPKTVALELLQAAFETAPAPTDAWRPSEPPPPGVDPLLGQWWTEGDEMLVTWEGERLRIDVRRTPGAESWLSPAGDDVWRVVEGRELGERLRVVRDDRGAPVKLYFATYGVTRLPTAFADGAPDAPRSS